MSETCQHEWDSDIQETVYGNPIAIRICVNCGEVQGVPGRPDPKTRILRFMCENKGRTYHARVIALELGIKKERTAYFLNQLVRDGRVNFYQPPRKQAREYYV